MLTAAELGRIAAVEKAGADYLSPLWNKVLKPLVSPGTVELATKRKNYATAEKMKNELFDSIKPTVEYKNPFLVPTIEKMPPLLPRSSDAAKLVPSAKHYPSSPLASKLDPYSVRDGAVTGDKEKQLNDILGALQRNFVPKGADAQAKITDMYRRLGLAGLTVGGAGATGATGYLLSGKDTPDTPQAPTPFTDLPEVYKSFPDGSRYVKNKDEPSGTIFNANDVHGFASPSFGHSREALAFPSDLREADESSANMQQQRNAVKPQEQPKYVVSVKYCSGRFIGCFLFRESL